MRKFIGKVVLAGAVLSIVFTGNINKVSYASTNKNVELQISQLIKEKQELISMKRTLRDGKEQKELGIKINEIEKNISNLKRESNNNINIKEDNKVNKNVEEKQEYKKVSNENIEKVKSTEEINKLIKEKQELINKKKLSKNNVEQKELGTKIGEIERKISILNKNQENKNSNNEGKPQWVKDKINYYNSRGKNYKGQADTNKSGIIYNGKTKDISAYKFNDNNYFKLRDIAMLSNESNSKFNIIWNEEKNSIEILVNETYKPVGGELSNIKSGKKDVVENISKIYKDGKLIELESYTIEGNNYFKLRDLGEMLDFEVDWDLETKNVIINM